MNKTLKPAILVDLKNPLIRIHKDTLYSIGNPEYILLLVNPKEYSSEQEYVNKCTELLEAHRNYIFSYVFKSATQETFSETYFQSFPYCTELQRLLEKHVEKFLQ